MRRFPTARTPFARGVLGVCAAWLLLLYAASAQAQGSAPRAGADDALRAAKSAAQAPVKDGVDDVEDEEGESESVGARGARQAPAVDPAHVLRTARLVYVNSDSVFVNPREVENSLLKRKEFRAWGMAVTRNPSDADLIIEITRKSLTRRFTFTVVDPRTMAVVASGKTRSVLLGKKIPNKIAEKFTNRLRLVRPYPPAGP